MRAIRLEDADDLFEYGSDKEVTHFMPWGPYQSLEDVKSSMQPVFLSRPDRGEPAAYAIIYKDNNKMIGTCDFHSINFNNFRGEIGFVLHKDYWNKGIMTRAVKEVINFGFEYLHLKRIQVMHKVENIQSRRVIEKNNFLYEGTLQKYMNHRGTQVDVSIYSLVK